MISVRLTNRIENSKELISGVNYPGLGVSLKDCYYYHILKNT